MDVDEASVDPDPMTQPGLLELLDELVYPETRGTPISYLRWTPKSPYELADELVRRVRVPRTPSMGRKLDLTSPPDAASIRRWPSRSC